MDHRETKHNYGIDLLRTVAMLMIVAHHFTLHSGIVRDAGSFEGTVMSVLTLGGKIGVNVFVLITGYYSTGRIRKEKVFDLISTATFYSVFLTILACLVRSVAISKKLFLKSALPVLLGGNYWFIVNYLELYLLIPVLAKIVNTLSEESFRRYLALFTVLLCIFPSVVARFIQVNDLGYNALVWFIYLYFLGAYLRRYVPVRNVGKYIYIACFVQIAATVILSWCSVSGVLQTILQCLADYNANAPLPLLIAVLMLLKFRDFTITKNTRLVQTIGAATLGIYLFHDNVNFRNWMWATSWNLFSMLKLRGFVVNAALTILMVFVAGLCVELGRKAIFDKVYALVRSKRVV